MFSNRFHFNNAEADAIIAKINERSADEIRANQNEWADFFEEFHAERPEDPSVDSYDPAYALFASE